MPATDSTTTDSAHSLLSFAEQAAAFAVAHSCTPFETGDLNGTPMRVREELVRRHGHEDATGTVVYPGRTVIEVPGWTWPAARPEDCPAGPVSGIWFGADGQPVLDGLDPDAPDGIVLLCALCGLSCT